MARNSTRFVVNAICYSRGLFPEDQFRSTPGLGMQMQALQRTSPEANQLIDWVEDGVFDALNKARTRPSTTTARPGLPLLDCRCLPRTAEPAA